MKKVLLGLGGMVALCAGISIGPSVFAADMDSARAACATMGLNPSEAPFAYCVQSLSQSAEPQVFAMNPPTSASDAGGYYRNSTTGYRAENACAAVGLDPTTARYSYCVSNLNQTLFDEQNFLTR
jgi:hypothetical protein